MTDPNREPRGVPAIVIPTSDGEARISLHPISLALLLAEVMENRAYRSCRRRGHARDMGGHCERCGTSLPDTSTEDYRSSWHPGVIRSWGPRPTTPEEHR